MTRAHRRDVTRRKGPGSQAAVIAQRHHDWGWDAVLRDGTVVHSWPSEWRKSHADRHSDDALKDGGRLGHIAQAWCRRYNTGGAKRERAMREAHGRGEVSK